MTSKTIEEKLDSMNIEEYELLLKGIEGTDKSKVLPEHAKIIDQIQHQMKTKPEEAITSLTNSKHSSSLQSLVQKEKGKNHHKVPNNSSRPDDSYQQQQNQSQTNTSGSKTVIPYNTSQSSSATVGAKQLPARYFFNCVQDDGDPFPNQERPPEADGERSSESRNVNSVSRCADLHDDRSGLINKSNIELRENYPAVESCIARPPFNESLRGQFKGSTNSNLTSSSLISNYPALISAQTLTHPQTQVVSPANSLTTSGFSSSPPPSNSARGSSDGSSRRLDETHGRKKAKAKDKEDKKVNSYKAPVTQYNAETDVDKILIQLEGPSIEGKRGNKNKKRGVKSMSLDDDNLSIAAKKTADRVTALKTTANNNSNNNNNNNNNSHNNIQSSPSSGKGEENKKDNNLNIDKEPFKGSSSSPPQGININNNNNKRNSGSQASGERESDGEDNRSPVRSKGDVNFTLVIRGKRKNNKTASTSSSIGNPVGKGDDRQEDSSRKGRSRGERRKSVGSVPGSDQSEGSDDGSVRSLPAGECTKRENIPKSCASSGGTPQTSYADIARLTKDEDTKKEVPQALEDYPSLQAFENSEGSDDSSDRFIPTEDLAAAPGTIKDGAAGKQSSNVVTTGSALTSYADIARLASHEEQKKEESNYNNIKKDQASEEFPELNSSTSLTQQQQESCSTEPSSSLVSPSSDLSAGKYPSSDSGAFPQLIATTSSATSLKSNSSSQGSSNIKNMSSVVSSSAVAGAAAKVTNSLVAPAPASSTAPGAPTPTTTTTQKAQTNSIASPTVVSAASSAATKSTDHKNNITTNVSGGGAGNPVVVSAAAALNPRVPLAPPSSVAVVNSSSSTADNVLQGGGGTNSKSNPDRHNSPPVLHSNASKDSSSPICVNGHLSDSDRDMKVMKRSDIPGAKMMMTMDKSSISIAAPTQQQLNIVDSGLSQCTEAVVFCGENFKEPPQLPSKGLQFEFGFNVSEVLDDINKKVSPDAAVPPTGISVRHTKGNNNNLPSPPQKDGGYPSSKGYHHHGSSNKQQQQHQQGGYGPRSNRGEDPRHRGGEVAVDRNGSSGRVPQNNNRSDSQGQRKIMPHASAHYNEVDDSSSKPPASGGGVMSDAQVVSAKSDVRLPSTGMSERSQSFKAAQPKAAGHNSKKSSFQTVQPVFADGVVQPPDPAQTPPSLLPSSEVVYSKQQPTIVSQYPLGAAPIAIHGGGGPGVPPVYGVTGYVTASASPSNYSNRLPAPPPHMTGPPFVPPPQPYEATQTPPQYIQQVYSIRTAPAPVATTTGHQEDHSTTENAQPPQMPPPTGPVLVNADYLMNLSASSTTSHPHHGPPARQPQQSTVVHSQRGFNHQVPAHHHHHQQHHHHHQHNYSANVVDNAGSSGVFTSEGREVNSAATTTTVTGSLTYPIDFASRFVSPDPSRYSSANVEDLRNYLTRRQRECQRLRNENENVREIT